MSLRPLLPLLVLALAIPASGSTLEDATSGFVAYQFDGDTHHDAPDACSTAGPEWSAVLDGSTDGILVAPDDVSDVYVLDVPASRVGQRVQVSLDEPGDVENLELQAFLPGCTGSVFDLVNWPTPEPTPPAPAPGQARSSLDGHTPRVCDGTQWEFWAEIMPAFPPAASIHVAWTDGSERALGLTDTHGVAHALYATDHALGVTLKGAWINMPEGWSGEFFVGRGPCDAQDGGAVYGEPPLAAAGLIDFTPVSAGPHVLQVTYRGAAGDLLMPIAAPATVDPEPFLPSAPSEAVAGLTGTLESLLGHEHDHGSSSEPSSVPSKPPTLGLGPDGVRLEPPGGLAMPRSCHTCVDGVKDVVEKVSYVLSVLTS